MQIGSYDYAPIRGPVYETPEGMSPEELEGIAAAGKWAGESSGNPQGDSNLMGLGRKAYDWATGGPSKAQRRQRVRGGGPMAGGGSGSGIMNSISKYFGGGA